MRASCASADIASRWSHVHAEVEEHGVTVTAVCPGPVPSGFQAASDAEYFAERLPKFTFVSPERVARDALAAAERGRISVIPGGPQVRAARSAAREPGADADPQRREKRSVSTTRPFGSTSQRHAASASSRYMNTER
jgi:hypothetical protein